MRFEPRTSITSSTEVRASTRRPPSRARAGGGGMPRVDSGRNEGGTVYLQQIHADAGTSVVYAITRALQLDVGYHRTYFYQHEKSHEDDNAFELYDNGLRVGLTIRF